MERLYQYRRTQSAPAEGKDERTGWDGGERYHHYYLRDLPEGPTYLAKEALQARVQPPDSQMALACLYANRYYTQARMAVACRKLYNSEPSIFLYDQYEDKKVGLRMITFTTALQHLTNGEKIGAAVFAFRGTRLTKAGTVSADIQLVKDRNAEMYITQRAMKHVAKEIRRLHKEFPDVQWGFFTTGHSLGALTAIVCTILCNRILASINFESPGLTSYYHRLAAEQGDHALWQRKVINYLAIPNPINMCQRHLGRIYRVHFPRIECQTDALHVAKCLFATAVRFFNWFLAASTGYAALRLLLGVSASAAACASLLMSEGALMGCALELAATPAGLTRGMYWTLHSASAYVAAKLGTNLRYILQQHSQWHMAQAFDGRTGLPYKAVEMRSWPKMERISGSFRRTFTRAVIESFYATDTSEGIWVINRRNALIEARIRMLPGYEPLRPAEEDAASLTSEASNAWVWQLGDVFDLWADDGEGAEHEVADLAGFDRSSRRRGTRSLTGNTRHGEDADSEADSSSTAFLPPSGPGEDTDDTSAAAMGPRSISVPNMEWWGRQPPRRRRSAAPDAGGRRMPSVVPEDQERQEEGRSASLDRGHGAPSARPSAGAVSGGAFDSWRPSHRSAVPDARSGPAAEAETGQPSRRVHPRAFSKEAAWREGEEAGVAHTGCRGDPHEGAEVSPEGRGRRERGRVRWSLAREGVQADRVDTLSPHSPSPDEDWPPGDGLEPGSPGGLRGPGPLTETDTAQGGETETDTGAVYSDVGAGRLLGDDDDDGDQDLDGDAGAVQGGSPKCVLLSGPENAAEYYGWPAAGKRLQKGFSRFAFWPRGAADGKPKHA